MEKFATKEEFQSLNDKISSLSDTILSLVPNIKNLQSSDKVIQAISGSESEEEVIFGNANKTTRLRDAKLQNIQKGLMKSLNVLTYSYDHIHRSENDEGLDRLDSKTVTSMMTDAMALLADTSHSLDIIRRQYCRYNEEGPICTWGVFFRKSRKTVLAFKIHTFLFTLTI